MFAASRSSALPMTPIDVSCGQKWISWLWETTSSIKRTSRPCPKQAIGALSSSWTDRRGNKLTLMIELKKALLNLSVLVASIGLGLLLCEFTARLVLNPADFLRLEVVHDDVLGAVPSPSAMAAFDRWGFRNPRVPESADIVAVGDSHTYGNSARMVDSWPYVLSRLTGRKIYNMGLGGYGPNQYFYLSKTKALSLKPKMII